MNSLTTLQSNNILNPDPKSRQDHIDIYLGIYKCLGRAGGAGSLGFEGCDSPILPGVAGYEARVDDSQRSCQGVCANPVFLEESLGPSLAGPGCGQLTTWRTCRFQREDVCSDHPSR